MIEHTLAGLTQNHLWNGVAGDAWLIMQERLDRLFAPMETLLVNAARWHKPRHVLDIGCGTGAVTLATAETLSGCRCLGVDLSQRMIRRAQERAAERRIDNARFRAGDAAQLSEIGRFDMALSRFGVMFFDDPVSAFAGIRTAMRPGFPLAAIAWRAPAESPFMTCAERAAAPFLPPLPQPAPGAPGQFAFADAERIDGILRASGWRNIAITPVDVACAMPETDLMPYLSNMGRIGIQLRDCDEGLRSKVLVAVRTAFDQFVEGNTVRFTAACWMIEAQA